MVVRSVNVNSLLGNCPDIVRLIVGIELLHHALRVLGGGQRRGGERRSRGGGQVRSGEQNNYGGRSRDRKRRNGGEAERKEGGGEAEGDCKEVVEDATWRKGGRR